MLARILELDRSPLFTDPMQHRVRRTWYDLAGGSGGDPTIPPMDLLDTPIVLGYHSTYQVYPGSRLTSSLMVVV